MMKEGNNVYSMAVSLGADAGILRSIIRHATGDKPTTTFLFPLLAICGLLGYMLDRDRLCGSSQLYLANGLTLVACGPVGIDIFSRPTRAMGSLPQSSQSTHQNLHSI